MSVSDPALYPARAGSAEAVRQDIWRTRVDLEEALSELLRRFDVKAEVRRRLARTGTDLTRSATVRYGLPAALVTSIGLASYPATRRHRRLIMSCLAGAVGVAAGAALVMRRQSVLAQASHTQATYIMRSRTSGASGAALRDSLRRRPGSSSRDVVDLLLAQHRVLESSFRQVREARGQVRFELFTSLIDLLHQHEHVEQEIVHPALIASGNESGEVAAVRLDEETQLDLMVGRLISTGVGHPTFDRQFDSVHEAVRAHMAHEEAEEFPLLRASLPPGRLQSMANQVRAAQSEPW